MNRETCTNMFFNTHTIYIYIYTLHIIEACIKTCITLFVLLSQRTSIIKPFFFRDIEASIVGSTSSAPRACRRRPSSWRWSSWPTRDTAASWHLGLGRCQGSGWARKSMKIPSYLQDDWYLWTGWTGSVPHSHPFPSIPIHSLHLDPFSISKLLLRWRFPESWGYPSSIHV